VKFKSFITGPTAGATWGTWAADSATARGQVREELSGDLQHLHA